MEIALNKLLDSRSMATVKFCLYKIIFTTPVMNLFKILAAMFFILVPGRRYMYMYCTCTCTCIIAVPRSIISRAINLVLSNLIGQFILCMIECTCILKCPIFLCFPGSFRFCYITIKCSN